MEEDKLKIECLNCLSTWKLNEETFDNGFDGMRADLMACPLCWKSEETKEKDSSKSGSANK